MTVFLCRCKKDLLFNFLFLVPGDNFFPMIFLSLVKIEVYLCNRQKNGLILMVIVVKINCYLHFYSGYPVHQNPKKSSIEKTPFLSLIHSDTSTAPRANPVLP